MLKMKLIKSITASAIALTAIASIFPTMSVNAMTRYVDYNTSLFNLRKVL